MSSRLPIQWRTPSIAGGVLTVAAPRWFPTRRAVTAERVLDQLGGERATGVATAPHAAPRFDQRTPRPLPTPRQVAILVRGGESTRRAIEEWIYGDAESVACLAPVRGVRVIKNVRSVFPVDGPSPRVAAACEWGVRQRLPVGNKAFAFGNERALSAPRGRGA